MRSNSPHSEVFEGGGDAEANGFSGHGLHIPIWAQQQRFGISLSFTTVYVVLDTVVADIASIGDTIRPALAIRN